MMDKSFYNTILSQTFSWCGNYLLAGNTYGQIAVYNLGRILNPKYDNYTQNGNADYTFTVDASAQICSMASTEHYLVVGTHGEVSGWDWSHITDGKAIKPSWKIRLPESKGIIDPVDVNAMFWSRDNEQLLAGCGDNNIYSLNLEEGRVVRSYEAHGDYIHSIHCSNSDMVSAGEDGLVYLWDTRSKSPQNKITPHTEAKLSRPDLGKWMGAATLGDDWIICGGGPKLSLWQTRSLQATTVFDLPDEGIHVAYFLDDRILAAGAARHLYQLSYSGEVTVELPVSATTVYSAISQPSPHRVFTIAGSSNCIDLCTTFTYRDQILKFY